MAVPLWLLYELGIVLASFIVKPVADPIGQSDYRIDTTGASKCGMS